MARASVLPDVLKNPMVYYNYDIQEGDTPEIIAHKYYGDSYRYWIVLFANQLLDPQWDWPMTSSVFQSYLTEKYGTFAIYSEAHHYEKIITQYDANSQTTTVETIIIDEGEYNTLVDSTNTYTLPSGPVTITTTKLAVSYYDYESRMNENKRNIRILNSRYVDQLESQFKSLMA